MDAVRGESGKEMRAEWSPELEQKLKKLTIQPRIVWEPGAGDDVRERVAAVKRWFENDWQKLDNKIKSSIVEGVSVFLSMFDMPDVAAVFCPPPPEVSDDPRRIGPKARAAMLAEAKAKAKGQGKASAEKKAQESRQWPGDTIAGRPRHLPPLYELIEGGKVLAFEHASREQPGAGPRHRRDAQKRMASSPAHAARADEGIPKHLLPARCLYLRRISILRVGGRGRSDRR